MSKVNYDEIKTLSTSEITSKIKSGEIVPPTDREERKKFLDFAQDAVDGPIRSGIVQPGQPPEKPTNDQPAQQSAEPSQETAPQNEPWWKSMGYADETEVASAHKTIKELIASQKATIDRFNGERGQTGRELSEAKKRLAELEAKLTETSASKPQPVLEKPKPPKPPSIKDFEDGILDEGYQTAMDQYLVNQEKYNSDLDAYYDHRLTTVSEEARGALPKVEELLTQRVNGEAARNQVASSWKNLWEREIPEFQTQFGLQTSVPVQSISDAYIALNSATATALEKDLANKLVGSLSERDRINYSKVQKAAEARFGFDDGYPVPKFTKWRSALDEAGILDEYQVTRPTGLTKQEEKEIRDAHFRDSQNTVTPPSGSSLASGDVRPTDTLNQEEVKVRFKQLSAALDTAASQGKAALDNFEKTETFQEYLKIRGSLMGGLPPALRAKLKP